MGYTLSMGPNIDAKHSRQQEYSYPPSPPSSATVTAHSSPRLSALAANDTPIIGHYSAARPLFRRANSHTQPVKSWGEQATGSGSDSDDSVKAPRHEWESPQSASMGRLTRKKSTRAFTLAGARITSDRMLVKSPPKPARPPFRRASYTSSSSSNSSGSGQNLPTTTSANPGIGRKVAASLQLFKETTATASTEDLLREPSRTEASIGRQRAGSSHKIEDVAEPQFEFVKRSEWPEREAAAMRRGESSTGLSRVRTRDSEEVTDAEPFRSKERKLSVRDTVLHDLSQWRKDVMTRQDSGRGRRLERATDMMDGDPEVSSPSSSLTSLDTCDLTFPSPPSRNPSRAYPPSPSPSRSPCDRSPPLSIPTDPVFLPSPTKELPVTHNDMRSDSRSPTPIQTSPTPVDTSPPFILPGSAMYSPPDHTTYSPWSTDDESGWETTSATTSTSTTSFHHISSSQTNGLHPSFVDFPTDDDEDERQPRYSPIDEGLHEPDADRFEEVDDFDFDLDMSQGGLPHIPLRPFRNQVGGHSAIYKFTKRAVCKVSFLLLFSFTSVDLTALNTCLAPRIPRKSFL